MDEKAKKELSWSRKNVRIVEKKWDYEWSEIENKEEEEVPVEVGCLRDGGRGECEAGKSMKAAAGDGSGYDFCGGAAVVDVMMIAVVVVEEMVLVMAGAWSLARGEYDD